MALICCYWPRVQALASSFDEEDIRKAAQKAEIKRRRKLKQIKKKQLRKERKAKEQERIRLQRYFYVHVHTTTPSHSHVSRNTTKSCGGCDGHARACRKEEEAHNASAEGGASGDQVIDCSKRARRGHACVCGTKLTLFFYGGVALLPRDRIH